MEFSELSKKAKAIAIENVRERYSESISSESQREVADYVENELVPELAKYGIDIEVVSGRRSRADTERYNYGYSGFYSQGDGFHFCTNWFSPWEFIKKQKLGKQYANLVNANKKIDCHIGGKISKITGSRYEHHNTVKLDTEILIDRDEDAPKRYNISELESQAESVLDEMFEFCQDKMLEAYERAREDYEALISDEGIESLIDANEITFNKDGSVEE